MTRAAPLVTVCIPVYNRAALVGEAIDSVLAQDFADFELLLIDDGSTDGSAAVLHGYRDPRVRVVMLPRNRGLPHVRNLALELARGRYLAWLDSDDVMAPRRLSRQVAFLDRREDIATVGGWVTRFAAGRGAAGRVLRPLDPGQLHAWLMFRSAHANTTLMGRLAVLRESGFDETFAVAEDYDLLVRMSTRHRMANLPRVLACMRQHDGRITCSAGQLVRAAKQRLLATQLARLGIAASDDDLQKHFHLTRMRREQWERWPDYAGWAGEWLDLLRRRNDVAQVYARGALAAVLGQVGMITCGQALANAGARRALGGMLRWSGQAGAALCGNLAFAAGWRR